MPTHVFTAPGKLILMGEHAAVYHRPALVAALDLRLRVTLSLEGRGGVYLDLPDVGYQGAVSWEDVQAYTHRVAERWRCYAQEPSVQAFADVVGRDPAHLVKVALGEAAQRWGGIPPLRVRVDSSVPVGAGFGSSAAVALAIIRAYAACRDVLPDDEVLYRLALDVERRQHGLPSGVDPATVLRGGIVWAQKAPTGEMQLEDVVVRSPALAKVHVWHTGAPKESTGLVVSAVRDRVQQAPARYEKVFDRMEAMTIRMRALLEEANEAPEEIIQTIRAFEACLEVLGVVPMGLQALIRQVEAHGGAAKVSGAGALSGPAAGSLLVYHPEAGIPHTWPFLHPLRRYPVRLGAEGVQEEDHA